MIYISAGHHEGAQGASWHGHTEWLEAVKWRDLLCSMINDVAVPVPTGLLRDKVKFINQHGDAELAVEIHFNSAKVNGVHVGKGSETLHHPSSKMGKQAAQIIQDGLAQVFPPSRGIKAGWHRQDRPGVVDYHGDVDGDERIVYFLRKTVAPAVILEPEFIHNIQVIRDEREVGCEVIATALLEYLDVSDGAGVTF